MMMDHYKFPTAEEDEDLLNWLEDENKSANGIKIDSSEEKTCSIEKNESENRIEIDSSDLSKFFEDKKESDNIISDESSFNSEALEDVRSILSIDSIESIEGYEATCIYSTRRSSRSRSRSKSRSSREPPRRRLRRRSPKKHHKITDDIDSKSTSWLSRAFPEIALSMDKLDASKKGVKKEQLIRLADLISGKRSTLTNSLDHSREQIRECLSLYLATV